MNEETIIREKQQQTAQLLAALKEKEDLTPLIETVREVLRFHEYRYYVVSEPLVSDFEYDQLYKELERIEAANPSLINSFSPTQRVAKGLTSDFPPAPHLVPMLSLDNSYNAEDLTDFDRKLKELSKETVIRYCVEPKFDGSSISLLYENDVLVRAATRGDGVTGDEITINARQIKSIPLQAAFSAYGIQTIEIRGEVLMSKKSFENYNLQITAQGLPPLANPRNAASGSLRIKDSKEVAKRNLEAFLYQISYYTLTEGVTEEPFTTHSEALQLLWNLGFRSPNKEKRVVDSIQEVVDYCRLFEEERDTLPYEIDGMVIKADSLDVHEKAGMTSHHPRWAIAYKFKARQAMSKLLSVEFQVGRTGSITPVAKIQPVAVGGVTIASISLFNEDVIKEKDILIGDTVLVERAGDVIPYIARSVAEYRTGAEQAILFPTNCPVCEAVLFKEQGEAVWRCVNAECAAQVAERIIHFVSKDAMDIRGMGDANVRRFHEAGILKDIPGIYMLDFAEINKWEGFGSRSVEKLKEAIEKSKTQPLHRLIFGLGIRFVGETTAKTLANTVNHLLELKNYSVQQLEALQDIGPKVATSIVHFFSQEANLYMLETLEKSGLNFTNTKKEKVAAGGLVGETFLFTGTLPTLKRDAAEAMVEALGGKIVSGVSSKLNYLVVGDAAGSKLEKAKKINTIKVITEAEFLSLLETISY